MKNYDEVVGIDESKKTIEAYCHQAQVHREFSNDLVGFKSPAPQSLRLCGYYNYYFLISSYRVSEVSFLQSENPHVIQGLQVKLSTFKS